MKHACHLLKNEIRKIRIGDIDYPVSLLRLSNPPQELFFRGTCIRNKRKQIAIVGSRASSKNGNTLACDLARTLAEQGVCVVSGGALGIDSAAHEGAIRGHGETIVVLGSGLDRLYPERNIPLFETIVERNGALISEFPLGTQPLRSHFPRRNRVIAALSDAVVVVEAQYRSGALSTAEIARKLNIPVLAVPGTIGANALIANGARPISTTNELLDWMQGTHTNPKTAAFSDEEQAILDALREKSRFMGDLSDATGIAFGKLATLLFELQFKGAVQVQAGGRYGVFKHALRKII